MNVVECVGYNDAHFYMEAIRGLLNSHTLEVRNLTPGTVMIKVTARDEHTIPRTMMDPSSITLNTCFVCFLLDCRVVALLILNGTYSTLIVNSHGVAPV